MFLPGSHFRRIHESDIGRYQNFKGQLPIVCKAGTLVVGHHGLWHCAQPNHTDQLRYMFKIASTRPCARCCSGNTDDLDDPTIPGLLFRNHKWYGNDDRLEYAIGSNSGVSLPATITMMPTTGSPASRNRPENRVRVAL